MSDEGSIDELWIDFADLIDPAVVLARLAHEGEEESTIEPSDIKDV